MNREDKEREAYKRVFSQIHIPQDVELERNNRFMKWTTRHAAALGLAAAIGGSGIVAYAADLGGVRTTVTGFFHGEKVQMEAEQAEDGSWNFYIRDNDEPVVSGGGVSFNKDGSVTELEPEELLDMMNEDVYEEDGRIWLSAGDRKWDVTDKFDKDGHAYLYHDGLYFDLSKDEEGHAGNWSTSQEKTAGINYIELK